MAVAIFTNHSQGKIYIFKNYQDALKILEEQGKVTIQRPRGKEKKKTVTDDCQVLFPPNNS